MMDRARWQKRLRHAAAVAGFVALTAIALAIGISQQQAVDSAHRAEAGKLLSIAELRFVDDPTEALAPATISLEGADTKEARAFAVKALWDAPPAFKLIGSGASGREPVFSRNGKWLAAAGHASEVQVRPDDGRGPDRPRPCRPLRGGP